MPDPLVAVAYQLGIRLRQCQYMAANCMSDGWGQLPEPIEPQYLALTRYAIGRVREAVQAFAASAHGCEALAQVAISQLDHLDGLWVTIEQWNNHNSGLGEVNACSIEQALHGLHETLARLADRYSPAQPWFELGHTICNGYLYEEPDRPSPVDIGRTIRRTTKRTSKSQPYWEWIDKETLDELLKLVNSDLEALCPVIEDDRAVKRILPYSSGELWTWFRIEVTLQRLLLEHRGQITSQESIASSPPYLFSPIEKAIYEALNGKALPIKALARAIGREPRSLYGRGKNKGPLKELQARGFVKYDKKVGCYRPDAPPPHVAPVTKAS